MNKFQEMIATEDLGWSLDKADAIFTWSDFNGLWADWSEWDSEQFIKHFTMVEREYYAVFPQSPFRASEAADKERSRALHPTAHKARS
jgi:hypothetical protein